MKSFNITLVYLMHDHGILRDIFFGSQQLKAKILSTLGNKPSQTIIPTIFDRFTFNLPSEKSPGF